MNRYVRHLRSWTAAAFAAAVLLVPLSYAQSVSGDLVGTVLDPAGAAVPNATVTATNTATNVKSNTTSNAAGEYRISNLPPGNYDVSASSTGFAAATLKNVRINLNQVATA